MTLGQTVTYPSLEGVSLCGSVPIQSVCVQWLWWEGWIWSDPESCPPQGGLAAITMVLGRTGGGLARARASYEPGLLLCSVANTPLFGIGVRSQVTGAEALMVRSELVTSLPSYPTHCGSFLQSWLYRRLSTCVQCVFWENFSTCSCIFDMLVVGGRAASSYSAILISSGSVLYHMFFMHSSIDGHLCCFDILTTVNNAAVNIRVYISFQISVFVFFGNKYPEVE